MFYDRDKWVLAPEFEGTNVSSENDKVIRGLDELLAGLGYERSGELYKAVRPNNDTVVFFCHFAVQCVMLGHLLGISCC